jgi:hypothetical protein
VREKGNPVFSQLVPVVTGVVPAMRKQIRIGSKLKRYIVGKHFITHKDNLSHKFMRDEVAVADDIAITGSFTFSNNG